MIGHKHPWGQRASHRAYPGSQAGRPMRMAWRLAALGGLVAALSGGLLAEAVPASAADPVWTATMAPLPAGATGLGTQDSIGGTGNTGQGMSCPAVGSCVAVGAYTAPGAQPALIETLSGGSWRQTTAPLPIDAAAPSSARLSLVSCPVVGSCVAVGEYLSASHSERILVDTLSGGSWTASAAPLPSGGDFENRANGLYHLTCPQPGACVAVGQYSDSSSNNQLGLIETLSGGSWTATEAPLPSGAATTLQNAVLPDLSCWESDSCVAIGGYVDASSNQQGLIETLSSGTWTATKTPLPSGASNPSFTALGALSCPATGSCVATGVYADSVSSFNENGFFATLSGGAWTATDAPPLPADAAPGGVGGLGGLSCPAVGSCVATGDYTDSSGFGQALIETLAGGSWTATKAPLPVGSSTAQQFADLFGLSCPVAGSCVAVGTYEGSIDGLGVIETLSGGKWTATQATLPSGAAATSNALLEALACPAAGACVIAGDYVDATHGHQILIDSQTSLTPGALTPVTPARLLDTRSNNGATGPVPAGGTVKLQVDGRGGLPASGVGAVVLNVTVTQAKAAGVVTAYPDLVSRPGTSNLNFSAGQTVPNLVVVPVGSDGKVDLYNSSAGTVQLIADVSGYFAAGAPASAGAFGALTPARLLDTRSNNGATGPVPAGGTVKLQVDGRGGLPASGVGAVVLNVTVTQAKAAGVVTAYPDLVSRPGTSNLNFSAGQTVPNLVVVPVGSDGKVDLYNSSAGTVQLIADVSGYFAAGAPASAGAFGALTPARLLDTRSNNGATGPVPAGGTVKLQVDGRGGLPASGVGAVVLNVTVTQAKAAGVVTAYPDLVSRPGTSNLNFSAGQTVPNLVVVPVGSDGKVDLYNSSAGTVQLIADVSGYFST